MAGPARATASCTRSESAVSQSAVSRSTAFWSAPFRSPARRSAVLVALALLAALGAGAPPGAAAQASDPCGEGLEAAEERYVRGAFDEAVRLASRCLEADALGRAEEVRAYRLLILARLRQRDQASAQAATMRLLRAVPGYAPDPVQDPPSYVAFVTEISAQMRSAGRLPEAVAEPRFERRRTWLVIGGGLVLAGVLAIVAGG